MSSQASAASVAGSLTHSNERLRLTIIHVVEGMVSAASNLLTIGVFFFMQHKFGWNLTRNFALSAGLGVVYIAGALAAHPLSDRLGRRAPLAGAYGMIALTTLFASIVMTPVIATVVVLIFAFCSAITWPIIENLVSVSSRELRSHELARRLTVYNIVWASTGAMIIAVNGLIIEKFSPGIFLIPTVAGLAGAMMALFGPIEPIPPLSAGGGTEPPHPEPEPQLEQQRVLALWLARISVPAMYLMIYSLAAMLPSLEVIRDLRPAMQTLLSSVWLMTRVIVFVLLGATVFWHTRPRLLLAAAVTLLAALLVMTLPKSLMLLVLGQTAFGAAAGLIYMASLYFGMVLSEGSTEHGGYHEALIGLGMTLGPGVGAATQILFPDDQRAAVAAISGLLAMTVVLSAFASLRFRRHS